MIQKLKNDILDLIFPPRCLCCGKIGEFICEACRGKIIRIQSQTCPFCHKITRGGRLCSSCRPRHYLTGVIAVGYFRDPLLKEIIHQFKYEGIFACAEELSDILERTITKTEISCDLVAYAPMTRRRFNERGYNQSELLASALTRRLNCPLYPGLSKKNHTKPQVGLKRKERLLNLADAFEIKRGDVIAGKRVLLVDDVFTTGATMDECAKALCRAGARQVWGAVLARE